MTTECRKGKMETKRGVLTWCIHSIHQVMDRNNWCRRSTRLRIFVSRSTESLFFFRFRVVHASVSPIAQQCVVTFGPRFQLFNGMAWNEIPSSIATFRRWWIFVRHARYRLHQSSARLNAKSYAVAETYNLVVHLVGDGWWWWYSVWLSSDTQNDKWIGEWMWLWKSVNWNVCLCNRQSVCC